MLRSATALLMLTIATGCTPSPANTNADDRLKGPAALCAEALAGDDAAATRALCRDHLALTAAYFGW